MRLALDTETLLTGHGGASTYLLDLLPKLLEHRSEFGAQLGGDPEVLLLHRCFGELPDTVEWLTRNSNFEISRAPFAGRGNDLWRKLRLPSAERCGVGQLDVSHSMTSTPLPSRAALRIATMHRLAEPENKNDRRRLVKSFRRTDIVIVPSQRLAERLAEHAQLPQDRIVVIPPGVHERYLEPPIPATTEELCQRYPFLQEPYILTLGGSAEASRSVPFLVAAREAAKRQGSELPPLVVVARMGEAGEIARLIDLGGLAGELYVVEDLETEALPALYRGAQYLLEPSNDGAFGQSLIEAAACGVPAIAHPDCGALEVIGDAALVPEHRGRLASTDDPDYDDLAASWGDTMAFLNERSETRDRLGETARLATRNCTWNEAARRHWQVYTGTTP